MLSRDDRWVISDDLARSVKLGAIIERFDFKRVLIVGSICGQNTVKNLICLLLDANTFTQIICLPVFDGII